MRISAQRYHDFSAGHRVHGHESKCAHLHGHNYRAHWEVVQYDMLGVGDTLDDVGRVIDFSVINTLLCQWLEEQWDHRFLVWNQDHLAEQLQALDSTVVCVPFNPTAENMARYLVEVVGPKQLRDTMCRVIRVTIEETRKCSASYSL